MRHLIYLEPHEHAQLTQDYLAQHPIEAEIDFIEAIIGIPNLTHAWNQFGLRVEVVERVSRH